MPRSAGSIPVVLVMIEGLRHLYILLTKPHPLPPGQFAAPDKAAEPALLHQGLVWQPAQGAQPGQRPCLHMLAVDCQQLLMPQPTDLADVACPCWTQSWRAYGVESLSMTACILRCRRVSLAALCSRLPGFEGRLKHRRRITISWVHTSTECMS